MILLVWQVFWLIPPTHDNVERYVNWVLSAKQGDYFLADHMDQCQMLRLKAGYTFIIPSGQSGYIYFIHPSGQSGYSFITPSGQSGYTFIIPSGQSGYSFIIPSGQSGYIHWHHRLSSVFHHPLK